ncbi:L-ribulose-5-phosphate 4-epimerase [Leuconostoc mesenteroides]|uniref:L-ribulose-5-phosphate 4-epimerase n=1 Tax=Leuconostoc mesenteroides TaxID=1245 RepID=UPI0009FBB7AA|nr:L-ribulose-5-phosphate 4-epimerase [Leuconostoc mesenteroides]MBZ1516496.1 L-ribulose-5-phosphate 4-epimerase [Leuconostoc mesenteroides]MBZ1541190.1 L-ribulose-5-phosphate 4-epimerase [Leuconostoc mesenteroides]MCP9302761.1 L-ribulose-5-phosphate 4-epimerase [Leuconostoc mesenteroides]MCP9327088.1 L-ribulose-5-phosphate 4-epimerase [Leuconostoc mesenteroides]ORI79558.1 L-ribulose-5-phosphate 4-epimerase [Leuconostoc mesenteroides subsp. mesenteroides]
MLEKLKNEVYKANMALPKLGLVTFTWGNVSGIDREKRLFVIKPSGIEYDQLKPSDMVVVNLDGEVVEGNLNPSSETPTHAYLYQHFLNIGGITHTHSPWGVSFAAAKMDIPAVSTTHADTFYGDIPCAPALSEEEIKTAYELNTGKVIVSEFEHRGLDPDATPEKSVYNAKVLEVSAEISYHALQSTRSEIHVPQYLLDKHYYRKHGDNAYYGQSSTQSRNHITHA